MQKYYRYYFNPDDVDKMIGFIQNEKEEKIAKYGAATYESFMRKNKSNHKGDEMTVGDILTITGGNTNFYIQGTTEDDKIIQLAYGKVDDIKFPSVPYGKYEVEHMTVDGNFLYLIIN